MAENSTTGSPKREASTQSREANWVNMEPSTSNANVCNVSRMGQEVIILFGTNEPGLPSGEKSVQLIERIVLRPEMAQQLTKAVSSVMAEFEKRFGKIDIGAQPKGR